MARLLRDDLLLLSRQWLVDARTLFVARRYPGAYHAGGVALECALKARIAKATVAEEFPDRDRATEAWQHEPTRLLKLGDLVRHLNDAPSEIKTAWTIVKDWKVDSRYSRAANETTVRAFLDALDDPKDGVLPWLLSHC